jgi:hypothetical protein
MAEAPIVFFIQLSRISFQKLDLPSFATYSKVRTAPNFSLLKSDTRPRKFLLRAHYRGWARAQAA